MVLWLAEILRGQGYKTLVIESTIMGRGFLVGGYFMNTLTFRAPGEEILKEPDIL